MTGGHTIFVGLGSNLGDRIAHCRFAVGRLEEDGSIRVTGRSRFYLTEPQKYREQDWFVNAVVRGETGLAPEAVLARLKEIERRAGRKPGGIRFGPRVLDLDLLFYDALVLDLPGLTLPHPRLAERRFVLQPLCDIDPDIRHPVLGKTARELLRGLGESGQRMEPIS